MSGCKPARSDDVVPFVNRPAGFLEGRADHYATAVLLDGYAQPVIATTSAGRPIKLDGNPQHPAFRGGSTPFMQAAILDLYDPDRSQAPLMGGHPASWADFDGQMARWRDAWAATGGAGLRLLVGPTTSPTLMRQIAEFRASLPQARVHVRSARRLWRGAGAVVAAEPGAGRMSSSALTMTCSGQVRGKRSMRVLGASGTGMFPSISGCGCSRPRRRRP